MTTRSQVKAYQVKVMKKAGMEIPESFGDANPSGKADKPSIDRKTLANIKKFLKSRDYNHIDSGIELIRSMDDPSIFEVLLDACSIDNEGKFARSSLFTGTRPAQTYLDYALLNLIAYAPEDCNLDESLKRSNIESLLLDFNGLAYCVKQGIPEDEEEQEINDIVSLPDCISSLTKLTSLCLSGELLQNADALANCVNLTRLELYNCDSLKNVDFLPNLPNLTDLSMSFRLGDGEDCDMDEVYYSFIIGDTSIENIDGLYNCSKLERLTIERADFDIDLSKLSKLSNLTHLSLDECDRIDADGLFNLPNLTSLDLSDFKIGYSLSLNKIAGGDSWTVKTYSDGYPETVANLDELHALVIKFYE